MFLCLLSCNEIGDGEPVEELEALSGEEAPKDGGGECSRSDPMCRYSECFLSDKDADEKGGEVIEEIAMALCEVG